MMTDQTPTVMPWYRSPVFVYALTGFVTATAKAVKSIWHITIPNEAIDAIVEVSLDGIGLLSIGLVMFQRARSPISPLTATQGKADEKNAAPPAPTIPPGS